MVRGDLTSAEQTIEVFAGGERAVVTDIDGDPLGGSIHSDYTGLLPNFEAHDSLCRE